MNVGALNRAIYTVPLCVFAPFASLRETTFVRVDFRFTRSYGGRTNLMGS